MARWHTMNRRRRRRRRFPDVGGFPDDGWQLYDANLVGAVAWLWNVTGTVDAGPLAGLEVAIRAPLPPRAEIRAATLRYAVKEPKR